MAIELNSGKTRNLVNLLHTPDNTKREIIYLGIAEVVAAYLIREYTEDNETRWNEILLNLPKVLNNICELAIVDRTMFFNICNNIVRQKMKYTGRYNLRERITNCTNVLDFLGISNIYNTYLLNTIDNNHLELYKSAMLATYEYFEMVDEEVVPEFEIHNFSAPTVNVKQY